METSTRRETSHDPFADVYLKGRHFEIDDVSAVLSWVQIAFIYISYVVLLSFGYIGVFLDKLMVLAGLKENPFLVPRGFTPMVRPLEHFWLHRMYQRCRDCFERPIASVPGHTIQVMDRTSSDGNKTFDFTGTSTSCLNLGSYNYLGFAENSGPVIDTVTDSILQLGSAAASPRMEAGNFDILVELEQKVASFVGKEDAIVIGMGFATNSTTIPIICGGKGTLIISDTLNHNSLVTGSRCASSAVVRTFKHNNLDDLEHVLRTSIINGQPQTHRAWRKIFIVIEGIFSMEGEIANLRQVVALKKKYKAYLYVDEAHSIGALGQSGRGVCEYWGVDPADVDILMGTFTKAFGSVGGYVAGTKELISYLRNYAYGSVYATAMSPPCARQALSALKVIMGEDGTQEGNWRLERLHSNSNFFRNSLRLMGFHVFGQKDSPVIPLMVFHPGPLFALSRELLKEGIAIVAVGFPVTQLVLTRIRFCISSSHTREQLEKALEKISRYGDLFGLKTAGKFLDPRRVASLKSNPETNKDLCLPLL